MLKAVFKSLTDLASKDFRSILWKAIGLSLVLFAAIFVAVEAAFWFLALLPWPWLETIAAIASGFGLLVAFFFLMAPVTSLFAGFYLDKVSALVEARHYALEQPGKPLSGWSAVTTSLQFGLLVLVANIFALPLVFTGAGIFILFTINAYLLSREYFEMAAMRLMSPNDAKELRRANAITVFFSGFIPAGLALVPVLNLVVPIFATSYFTHMFRSIYRKNT